MDLKISQILDQLGEDFKIPIVPIQDSLYLIGVKILRFEQGVDSATVLVRVGGGYLTLKE